MEFSNTSGSASKRGSVSKEAPFLNQHRLKKEVQKIGEFSFHVVYTWK